MFGTIMGGFPGISEGNSNSCSHEKVQTEPTLLPLVQRIVVCCGALIGEHAENHVIELKIYFRIGNVSLKHSKKKKNLLICDFLKIKLKVVIIYCIVGLI